MRSLFAFLYKYQFFVLFVVLEVVSLLMLVNSYSYHKSLTFNAANDLSGGILSVSGSVENYFKLSSTNEQLQDENAILHNQLSSSFLITDTNYIYRDTLYRYLSAQVVTNSVNRQNNFILINKGSLHGVQKEMGVISSMGLAGIVTGVSEHYAFVMSMLHQNSRISGRIKKNDQLVNVVWDGKNYRQGEVIDIPSHIHLQKGDTIITSGNSLIFPQGIIIGTIIDHELKEFEALGKATMKFSTDFNSLQLVYIIENLMKEEQETLVNKGHNE